jgi:hypothetical protein
MLVIVMGSVIGICVLCCVAIVGMGTADVTMIVDTLIEAMAIQLRRYSGHI